MVSQNGENINDDILGELGSKKAHGKNIDVYEVVALIDSSRDVSKIRDWLIDQHVCSKSDWTKALANQKVKDFLGHYPQTATEYLNLWLAKHKIAIDYKRRITHDQPHIS